MTRFFAVAIFLVCGAAAALSHKAREAAEVTPIQKVLQMMNGLRSKGAKEKDEEVITFATFSQWCAKTEEIKKKAIEKGELKMGQLSADIGKLAEDSRVLADEISKIDATIAKAEDEKTVAQKARGDQKALYERKSGEIVDSIDQVGEGIKTVKSMMSGTEGGAASASLIQHLSKQGALPEHARKVLAAFIETSTGGLSMGPTPSPQEVSSMGQDAPEAAAFESKSGGIVDMMMGLEDRFRAQKKKADEEDVEDNHGHMTEMQSLQDEIEKSADIRSRKVSTMKHKEQDSAIAKSDLAATTETRASDQKYLDDLVVECKQKHEDFDARQKLRGDELEALDKAIEIIGGGDVSGAGEKHLPALVQTRVHMKKASLAQLRINNNAAEQQIHNNAKAAAAYLDLQGKKLNSRVLAALSLRVAEDPFAKVKKMIEGMVAKLMTEATDEAEHKGWCDTELSTNEQTREIKSDAVEELTAHIQEMNAKATLLTQEVSRLSEDITALDAAVAKATEIRVAEKQKNADTIADAKVAIAAVEKATGVLREFYAKAAGATAFSQMISTGVTDEAPQTFDKPYKGQDEDGQGGVIGMLEVILSDFQRLEAETTDGEAAAQREFDQFTADSSQNKAVKNTEVNHKTDEIAKLNADTADAQTDLTSTKEELDAAVAYFEKLKPSCIDTNASYEDRVARRKAEIESLHEALDILSSEGMFAA